MMSQAQFYDLQQNYQQVLQQIQQSCIKSQRSPQEVTLLAVSKTHSSEMIEALYQCGQRQFGENYVQESIEKIQKLQHLEIEWHFIGHVQRNKTKILAEHFAWVHGVDRTIIAQRLSQQRPSHLPALNICLQVNIDGQASKDGCAPDEVEQIISEIKDLENLRLRGLMVIPAPDNHQAFADAQQLFQKIKNQYPTLTDWDTLSMGMSVDLEPAIASGSNMVRIGTALFGRRDYSAKPV